jgi:predicted nucleic acid-binding protein
MSYMFDTKAFRAVLSGAVIPKAAGLELLVTEDQNAVLAREGSAALRSLIRPVAPVEMSNVTVDEDGISFTLNGVDFNRLISHAEAEHGDGDLPFSLADVGIVQTALKEGATVVTDNAPLWRLIGDFGGSAMSTTEFAQRT